MDSNRKPQQGSTHKKNRKLVKTFNELDSERKRQLALAFMINLLPADVKGCSHVQESLHISTTEDKKDVENNQKAWFAKLTLLLIHNNEEPIISSDQQTEQLCNINNEIRSSYERKSNILKGMTSRKTKYIKI